MKLDHVPWHDAIILQLCEEPDRDKVSLRVEFCWFEIDPKAEPESWGTGTITFVGCERYSVNEGPGIMGKTFVLSASELPRDEQLSWVRIETTCGYREFLCEAVEFVADAS